MVVLASFLNHVVVDGITFTFGIMFVVFQQQFESSKAQTAMVGSLLAGWYLMSGEVCFMSCVHASQWWLLHPEKSICFFPLT